MTHSNIITKTNERGKAAWWFEDKQGNCFYIDTEWAPYDRHVNLQAMTLDNTSKDCPTLNELVDSGEWTMKFCHEECVMNLGHDVKDINAKEVQAFFREKGYEISEEAILHNFNAWKNDYKSAFRDESNGTHLFTPSGHNPLSFRLTTLHPLCADWQTTYIS